MVFKSKVAAMMSSPNVIPMADVMLVLLIIFMVITPMMVTGGRVNMAGAANAEQMPNAEKDDAVIVAVTRNGDFFLSPGNNSVALDEISGDVRELVENRLDKIKRCTFARITARSMATLSKRWIRFGPRGGGQYWIANRENSARQRREAGLVGAWRDDCRSRTVRWRNRDDNFFALDHTPREIDAKIGRAYDPAIGCIPGSKVS